MPTGPKTVVPIPLGGGVDQSVGEKSLQPPAMVRVDDFVVQKDGIYTKPPSGDTLGTGSGTTPTDDDVDTPSYSLIQNRSQLAQITKSGLWAYRSESDAWSRRQNPSVYPIGVEVQRLAVSGSNAVNPDVAVDTAGNLCVVWEERETGLVFALFLDSNGDIQGGPVPMNTGLSNQYAPRVVYLNGNWIVFWLNADPRSSSGSLYANVYDPADDTYTFDAAVLMAGTGIARYDVHVGDPAETVGYFVYGNSAIGIESFDKDAAQINTGTFSGGNPAVYHDVANSQVYIYGETGGGGAEHRATCLSEDLATTNWTTTLVSVASEPAWHGNQRTMVRQWNPGEFAALTSWSYSDYTNEFPGIWVGVFDSSGNLLRTQQINDVFLHARGYYDSEFSYQGSDEEEASGLLLGVLGDTHNTFTQYPAAYLAQQIGSDDTGSWVDRTGWIARLMQDPSKDHEQGDFDWSAHMSSIVAQPDGTLVTALTRVIADNELNEATGTAPQQNEGDRARIDLVFINTTEKHQKAVEANEGTLVAEGTVGFYDRFHASENNILSAPFIIGFENYTYVAGPGGVDGAIDFSVVARWVDSSGRIHRSPPSLPRVLSTAQALPTDFEVDILIAPAFSRMYGDNAVTVDYEVYMSEAYEYGGAIPSTPGGALGGNRYLQTILRDPSRDATDEQYLNETLDIDNIFTDSEVEYVQAGELSSDPHDAVRDLVVTPQRAFALSADGTYISYSKPMTTAYGVEWNEAQRIATPGDPNRAVALEAMDDKIVYFAEDKIYVTNATGGEDNTGSGATFPQLRGIPTDTGCINRRSVVTTPVGILFQGRKGIYLLDRQLSVSFIGERVKDYWTPTALTDGLVTSAAVDPSRSEVIFGDHQDVNGVIVWNYEADMWYRLRSFRENTSMLVLDGTWYGLNGTTGAVRRVTVDEDDYVSATLTARSLLETPWIKLSSLQGFWRAIRFNVLGKHHSGAMRVRVAYDYSDTWSETYEWEAADLSTVLQVTQRFARQKVQAVKFEISERNDGTSDTGQGLEIEGLEIEVRAKPGTTARTFLQRTGT